jgi:hypothetical protein
MSVQIILRQRRLFVDAGIGVLRFNKANVLPRAADGLQVFDHFLNKKLAQIAAALQLQRGIDRFKHGNDEIGNQPVASRR